MGILKNHFTPNLCGVRKEKENEVSAAQRSFRAASEAARSEAEHRSRAAEAEAEAANNGALI